MTVKQLFDLCDEHSIEYYEIKVLDNDFDFHSKSPVSFDESNIRVDFKNETITIVLN